MARRRGRAAAMAEGQLSLFEAFGDDLTENLPRPAAVPAAHDPDSGTPHAAPAPAQAAPTAADPSAQRAGSRLSRARANVAAVEALARIEAGAAAEGDADALAAFSGWGGCPDVFATSFSSLGGEWESLNARLRSVLTEEEYQAAAETVDTAYYTPPEIVAAVWGAVRSLGLGAAGDRVLEPGCGTGNFMRCVPEGMAPEVTGIEADPLSARIAQALVPGADVVCARMEEAYISRSSWDAAVGNVPFSSSLTVEDAITGRTLPIHDWACLHAVDSLRPGGVAALLTSRFTLDKASDACRVAMACRAELVGLVRLPGETFRAQAGTDAVSDLLVLRRRAEDLDEAVLLADPPAWCRTALAPNGARANALVLADPGSHVAGRLEQGTDRFGRPSLDVVPGVPAAGAPAWAAERAASLLAAQPGFAGAHGRSDLGPRAEGPVAAAVPTSRAAFAFEADASGRIWYGDGQTVVPFEPRGRDGRARCLALISLRDRVSVALRAQRDPGMAGADVDAALAAMRAEYRAFSGRFGRLSEPRNRRAFPQSRMPDDGLAMLASQLEVTGPAGFEREADILSRRTAHPAPPEPESAGTPAEALSISIRRTGTVDVALVARLLGTDASGALDALGDSVAVDPLTGVVSTAEEWLSGDVGGRLASIEAEARRVRNREARAAIAAWRAECGASWPDPDRWDAEAVATLGREGVWDALTDPDGATRARDGEAVVMKAGIRWRGRPLVAARLLMEAPEGSIGRADGGGVADPAVAALLARGLAPQPYEDPMPSLALLDALALAASPEAMALPALVAAAGLDEAASPRNLVRSALARALGPAAPGEGAGAAAWAGAIERRPDAPEYLLATARGLLAGREAPATTSEYDRLQRDLFRAVSPEGLEAFGARRAAFLEARAAADPDRGAVVERLADLDRAAERLRPAAPEAVSAAEIDGGLGAPWIPATVVRDFAVERMGLAHGQNPSQRLALEVIHNPGLPWIVKGSASGATEEGRSRYGTPERSPYALLEAALNGSPVNVVAKDPSDPTGQATVPDPEATAAARRKVERLRADFDEWAWSDTVRAERLRCIYNARFNTMVQRAYTGSEFPLDGIAEGIELRPHQRKAVSRALLSGHGTLVAHAVGAGKTFAGAVAVHEAKRIGRCSKPLIVVPNHLTEQWAADYLSLYPGSRVLAMQPNESGGGAGARGFWARAAAGDWDAVIVGHSRFSRVQLSPERSDEISAARTAELRESIERAGEIDGSTVKQVRRAIARMEGRQRRRRAKRAASATSGVVFEDVGIDMLVVDEAHAFKNLACEGLPGLGGGGSEKCEDLLEKCDWLRSRGLGGNIVFLTGTPVSNSMAELYGMMRYLEPEVLEHQGCSRFADWALAFAKVEDVLEVKPESNGYQVKRRFQRFRNLPELMASFRECADVRSQEGLALEVPDVETVSVQVPASGAQRAGVAELGRRGDAVRAGGVDPTVDNMLKITSDGRRLALDPKLLHADDPGWEPMEGGKVAACVSNVVSVWTETADQRGAQLVFCDTSTPASGGWNVPEHLRDRLVKAGIPAPEIALVWDAGDSVARKEEMFERVRAGEVRVLIGSTSNLGTGTNVQDRLAAIHDLDCPWRPSDLEQRLGRIARQGNSYARVRDFRYVAEGTFDSYLYQVVERKQRFISQVFTERCPARASEDVDERALGFAELKALATGDPRMVERMELENDIARLELDRKAHGRSAERARERAAELAAEVSELETAVRRDGELEAPFAAARGALDAAAAPGADERARANASMLERALALRPGAREVVGSWHGLDVVAASTRSGTGDLLDSYRPRIGLAPAGRPDLAQMDARELYRDGGETPLSRLRRVLEAWERDAPRRSEALGRARADLETARGAAASPWPDEGRLAALKARLAALGAPGKRGPKPKI